MAEDVQAHIAWPPIAVSLAATGGVGLAHGTLFGRHDADVFRCRYYLIGGIERDEADRFSSVRISKSQAKGLGRIAWTDMTFGNGFTGSAHFTTTTLHHHFLLRHHLKSYCSLLYTRSYRREVLSPELTRCTSYGHVLFVCTPIVSIATPEQTCFREAAVAPPMEGQPHISRVLRTRRLSRARHLAVKFKGLAIIYLLQGSYGPRYFQVRRIDPSGTRT